MNNFIAIMVLKDQKTIMKQSFGSRISISPSMMCANPFFLRETLNRFEASCVDWLHIDIMDGKYVPNFTLGPDYCGFLQKEGHIPLYIHLMVENPDVHFLLFRSFEGARISFHPETVRQPVRLVEGIRELGCSPGIAVDPSVSLDSLKHLIPLVDQVTIMTVNPGYAGQKLIPFCLQKIAQCRAMIDATGRSIALSIDGNVSWENIPKMMDAGGDVLVVGTSSVFEDGRVSAESMQKLQNLIGSRGEN